ncbi:MAG: adenylate/guanylate cyclase domain-containing protein [Deltaproteobacteria bacterium]|nr:adenylate/guanylate cyclase domain-containing protein [Deltaproteobacteria bacterium]
MSIRSYLILSYLALVLLITAGMLAGAHWVGKKVRAQSAAFSENGVRQVTQANLRLSEDILKIHGEFAVEDIAQAVAKELSYILKGKKSYNYANMRRNQALRDLATQPIRTPEGVAGYVDLLDNKGIAVLHPNREVEGKNFRLWAGEFPDMWRLVERSFTEPLVKGYYSFLDKNGRARQKFMALAQVRGTPFIVASVVNIDEFFLPVHTKINQSGQEVAGLARHGIKQYYDELDWRVKMVGLIGAGGFSLIGLLFGLFFATAISRPLVRLRDGVREIGEGNFEVEVPEKGAKEVAQLAHSFNELGEQLTDYIAKRDFIRDTFGRYVTHEVVKRLLESEGGLALGGETREVSILMSDLRGFTALTSEMTPDEVITFLNRYLARMIQVLTDYKAIIDEIMGDGILAFFGAPEPLDEHPAQAVACALAMQKALEDVNAANARDGLPHLEMGIAVGTGQVVVGNIGSETRTKYSVVGSPVNFVSRMESFALGGQVLISTGTFSQIKNLIEVGEVLEVQMKGFPGRATLFEVTAIGPPYNLRVEKKQELLTDLTAPLPVNLYRMRDKAVIDKLPEVLITRLCDTAATLQFSGELHEWEDVRLKLLNEQRQELPGKIYGKVLSIQLADDGPGQAQVRFTSVSPDLAEYIRQAAAMGAS